MVALFLLCGFTAFAGAASSEAGPVTAVKVETDSLELICNDPEKNTCTVVPSFEPEGASFDGLSIVSGNPKVVEVVDGNVLRAVGPGDAKVTVTAVLEGARISPQCVIRVRVVKRVTDIAVSGGPFEVAVKKTLPLQAKVEPADATNKKLIWKSSDETVATVTANGVVRGLEAGEVTISATAADGCGTVKEVAVKVLQPVSAVKTLSGYHQGMTWEVEVNKTIPISNAFAVQPGNASNKELDFTVYSDGRPTESGYVITENEDEGFTEITFTEPGVYFVEAVSRDGAKKSPRLKMRIYSKDLMTLTLNKAKWSLHASDELGVSFEIRNKEYGIAVESAELYIYAEDALGNKLFGGEVYKVTTGEIGPGACVCSEYLYLPGRSSIAKVYCGIHTVKYADPRMPVRTCDVDYLVWDYQ